MGAKQSKRSVDISGKEAESAGEVAAAGAGGEGRVEALVDGDALKPQLNGDAHIQPPQDISDKEKQLDTGTPENEKDATTEKEGKEEQNSEKEAAPATNGESEPKENGDSAPAPEDGKKPKKEKVKKKWSLRSISFSRKDKPKQEKKSKEEEPKTNGEPEKVPEEAAEATVENVENKVAEEVKDDTEVKEEKTPETPVTEPLTNGSSTPDDPKAELAADAPAPLPEPDQLPVNGLSLEEPKKEPEVAPIEESKPEETTVAATETVPAPEIPVKTEVCDAKMPLIEPTPPPLPANPPPSSVASFAATTMAPELTEASLANTTENVILALPVIPAEKPIETETEPQVFTNYNLAISQVSPPLKEAVPEDLPVATPITEAKNPDSDTPKDDPQIATVELASESEKVIIEAKENLNDSIKTDVELIKDPIVETDIVPMEVKEINIPTEVNLETKPEFDNIKMEIEEEIIDSQNDITAINSITTAIENEPVDVPQEQRTEDVVTEKQEPSIELSALQNDQSPESVLDVADSIDDLPPPPPLDDDILQRDVEETEPEILAPSAEEIANTNQNLANDVAVTNGITDIEHIKIKDPKRDALGNVVDVIECNGNGVPEEYNGLPPPAALPQPVALTADPQDPLPVADKIADLIPETPTVPELNTETEAASAVAVAD